MIEHKIKDEINKLWQPAQKEKVYAMEEESVGQDTMQGDLSRTIKDK